MFFTSLFFIIFYSTLTSAVFHLIPTNGMDQNFSALRDDLETTTLQLDVMSLISDVLNKTQPKIVGFIVDSIYRDFIYNHELIASLNNNEIIFMSVKDSESFEDDPPEKVQKMLVAMREVHCDLYILLITNGIQMTGFLKYADYNRLINTKANILMLHDYRLFTPELHYIWNRIVNVIFIRKCDMDRDWFELSTVPFPTRIKDVLVTKVVNFWTPPNHYRWKTKKIFEDKSNQHLNGEKLNVVVLQHTPTVSVGSDNSSFSGLEIDIVKALMTVMNFTANFYETEDSDSERWGRKFGDGRNFSGLLGEMDGAMADIALADLHYTIFHLDIMDLSNPYTTECLTFITPEILSDNSWKVLILPFSLGMWCGVLVSLFLAGIVFFMFSNLYTFMRQKNQKPLAYFSRDFFDDISACLLYTYSMVLVVSLPRLPLRWSVRVLTGWWWIYAVLIVVAYRASLTAILANPQPRLTIDKLEVLANSRLKCGAWGDENRKIFVNSIDPASQQIGSKLEHVEDADDAVSNL
jgi:Ligand-gated ion channel/Ligated ion channel L-glutamate- and glycine-binding site